MSDDMATSGGGLHPGRPVIWPTGKPTPPITQVTPQPTQTKSSNSAQQSSQSQSTQQSSQSQSTQQSSQSQSAQQSSQTTQSSQSAQIAKQAQAVKDAVQAQVQAKKQVVKEFTVQDLKQHLVNQQIDASDANVKMATLMLRYGMEVSKSSMAKVMNMISGTDKSVTSQEAAVLLLMKGVDSPQATQTLAAFLKENPHLASQLMNTSANVADLQAALNMAKGTLPNEILQALSAVLAQFDESILGLPKKYKFTGDNSTGRTELVNDMRALKALLSGIQQGASLPDTAEGQIVQSNMMSTMESLDNAIENVVSQSFLSKQTSKTDVNYSYYQVPNSMAKPPQTAEIIIKRENKEGGKKIDPKDTQIIMSLDTENMGRVAVNMTIKNNKIDFIFNTQNSEVKELIVKESGQLNAGLSDKDYVTTKMQVNVNPSMCAVKPYLIPFLGIEDLMRIDISI